MESKFDRRHSQFPLFEKGISSTYYPTFMELELDSILLNGSSADNVTIDRLSFQLRGERQVRHARRDHTEAVSFSISYHSLLFDVIKINLLKTGFMSQSHSKYGQAVLKLSEMDASVEHQHIVTAKVVSYKKKEIELGSISFKVHFYDFCIEQDPNRVSMVPSNQSLQRFNTAPSASFLGLPALEEGIEFNSEFNKTQSMDVPESRIGSTYDTSYYDSYSVSGRTSVPVQRDEDDDTNSSVSTLIEERRRIQRSKSLDSLSYAPPPTFQKGLNNSLDLAYGLIATGWRMNPLSVPSALKLLGQYYKKYSIAKTGDLITDLHVLEEADYFMNFMIPSYGGIPKWFFGHGGLLDGMVKPNKKITMDHLFVGEEHMLAWHYKVSGVFSTTPCFYIVYDKITNSIHLHIRGTFNVQDVLTDVTAEYAPFMGGSAHSGMLNAAVYIRDNYFSKIINWIRQFKAQAFYITGHSLGAGVSSLLLMLCRDKVMLEMGSEFTCLAYTFACPPCVSANVMEPYNPYIIAYLNQHDIVPKLSYGSTMDFKSLLQKASALNNTKGVSLDEKLQMLDDHATELTLTNKNPRLVIPGQVYLMYKLRKEKRRERSKYVVERSSYRYFDHFHLQYDMVWHHLPQKYDNSLKKAIKELESGNDQ